MDMSITAVSSDPPTRLKQLSEDVNRIASTLALLANMPVTELVSPEASEVSPQMVRQMLIERQLRHKVFENNLFTDPAWAMLLDLFHAELTNCPVSVTSLCVASGVPQTTALRWIAEMVASGHIEKKPDLQDRRRVFVTLTRPASRAMANYFAALKTSRTR